MKYTIFSVFVFISCATIGNSQSTLKEKLYTKSCDTLNLDTMICIKCTNQQLTIGCKRYACDFKNHCVPMPVAPPKNKSKDIKTILPGGTQKKS
ncbi:MAG: hypothetical protein IPI45_06010 [Saprospiraceae bacterium]|nr:hypothetical protein [Saprospiraceae bacterium]MBK7737315.1 hypothetical protein [Saprospiraceae bacterium]MBK7914091.1 hypothetical protein [Saprospiraceae bacterium]